MDKEGERQMNGRSIRKESKHKNKSKENEAEIIIGETEQDLISLPTQPNALSSSTSSLAHLVLAILFLTATFNHDCESFMGY